jgi:hypothetical protein
MKSSSSDQSSEEEKRTPPSSPPSYPSLPRPPKSEKVLFPVKLHKLLEDGRREGGNDAISWSPDGKSFKVHDKDSFASDIMPTYFGSSKYRSFQKNLSLWQFKTARSPRHLPGRPPQVRGECYHPLFVRDCPAFCNGMKRVVGKNKMNSVAKNSSRGSSRNKKTATQSTSAKNANTATRLPPADARLLAPQNKNDFATPFGVAGRQMIETDRWSSSPPRSKLAQELLLNGAGGDGASLLPRSNFVVRSDHQLEMNLPPTLCLWNAAGGQYSIPNISTPFFASTNATSGGRLLGVAPPLTARNDSNIASTDRRTGGVLGLQNAAASSSQQLAGIRASSLAQWEEGSTPIGRLVVLGGLMNALSSSSSSSSRIPLLPEDHTTISSIGHHGERSAPEEWLSSSSLHQYHERHQIHHPPGDARAVKELLSSFLLQQPAFHSNYSCSRFYDGRHDHPQSHHLPRADEGHQHQYEDQWGISTTAAACNTLVGVSFPPSSTTTTTPTTPTAETGTTMSPSLLHPSIPSSSSLGHLFNHHHHHHPTNNLCPPPPQEETPPFTLFQEDDGLVACTSRTMMLAADFIVKQAILLEQQQQQQQQQQQHHHHQTRAPSAASLLQQFSGPLTRSSREDEADGARYFF